jgi:hypothetical protein
MKKNREGLYAFSRNDEFAAVEIVSSSALALPFPSNANSALTHVQRCLQGAAFCNGNIFLFSQPACQTESFMLFYGITEVMDATVKSGYCGLLRFMTLTLTVVSHREVGILDLYDDQPMCYIYKHM